VLRQNTWTAQKSQNTWMYSTRVVCHSVATLLWRKTPEFTLTKKQKIIKKPRHTKC